MRLNHESILPLIRAAFWLLAAFVAAMAWLPVRNPALTEQHPDKTNHIAAFLVLSIVLYHARYVSVYQAAMALFGYGIFIEAVQQMLPYRSFSTGDILANGIGILGGYLIVGTGRLITAALSRI